jgi:hypothetical protein
LTSSSRLIRASRSSAEWSTWLGMTVPGIAVTMSSTLVTRLLTSSRLRNVPLATQANRFSPGQNTQSSRIMIRC